MMLATQATTVDMAGHGRPCGLMRVLHVVAALNRGGAETWLVDVLRRTDRTQFQVDVLTQGDHPAALDDAVRATGASIIPGPATKRPWSYGARFRQLMRDHGPYDAVHVHMHHFSGLVLRSAAQAGIPVRIVHSHSDTRGIDSRAHAARRVYLRLSERWVRQYSTRGLAVSRHAAASLFGEQWESDPRISVIYCGIDLKKFTGPSIGRAAYRTRLGVPPDARVFGHIGRFAEPKNHVFLIEIFKEIAVLEPDAWFVLAGDGPLRTQIQAGLERAGISCHTLLLGMRSDVPEILTGLIDTLVFPSLWEGLPITLIESQAAGVPALSSDAVTEESVEVASLVRRLSLRKPAAEWAREAIWMAKGIGTVPDRKRLEGSRFDIQSCVSRLQEIYRSVRISGVQQ